MQSRALSNSPRLNMAMPRPASDRMAMDFMMMAGISKFQLPRKETEYIH
jgi:hypothetical protein